MSAKYFYYIPSIIILCCLICCSISKTKNRPDTHTTNEITLLIAQFYKSYNSCDLDGLLRTFTQRRSNMIIPFIAKEMSMNISPIKHDISKILISEQHAFVSVTTSWTECHAITGEEIVYKTESGFQLILEEKHYKIQYCRARGMFPGEKTYNGELPLNLQNEAISLIEKYYKYYNSKDLEGLLSCYKKRRRNLIESSLAIELNKLITPINYKVTGATNGEDYFYVDVMISMDLAINEIQNENKNIFKKRFQLEQEDNSYIILHCKAIK